VKLPGATRLAPRAQRGVVSVGDDLLDVLLYGRWRICGPPAPPLRGEASNHLKRLQLNAGVVSVGEKAA